MLWNRYIWVSDTNGSDDFGIFCSAYISTIQPTYTYDTAVEFLDTMVDDFEENLDTELKFDEWIITPNSFLNALGHVLEMKYDLPKATHRTSCGCISEKSHDIGFSYIGFTGSQTGTHTIGALRLNALHNL